MRRKLCAVALVLLVAACAGRPEDNADYDVGEVYDPLEDVNRAIFDFNLFVDDAVLQPVARGYRDFFSEGMRDVVHDFLQHAATPVVLINNFIQGDMDGVGVTMQRFFLNTVVGFGGIYDVASKEGYERDEEDFGQTLGVYGAEDGAYLMLPILGPSNVRDLVGRIVDLYLDPFRHLAREKDAEEYLLMGTVVKGIDTRERNLERIEELKRDSVDFYARIRSLYTQNRRSLIVDGELDEEDFPTPGLSGGDNLSKYDVE